VHGQSPSIKHKPDDGFARRGMPEAVLHKYLDFGARALSNVSLQSGERVLLSIAPSGFALRRLHLRGLLPGRSLFSAAAPDVDRMARVLERDAAGLPALPRAAVHRDEAAMLEFVDAATADLKAIAENRPVPGAVDALDLENRPERPLSLLTRLALTARDAGRPRAPVRTRPFATGMIEIHSNPQGQAASFGCHWQPIKGNSLLTPRRYPVNALRPLRKLTVPAALPRGWSRLSCCGQGRGPVSSATTCAGRISSRQNFP
jgi:hypothetical protein